MSPPPLHVVVVAAFGTRGRRAGWGLFLGLGHLLEGCGLCLPHDVAIGVEGVYGCLEMGWRAAFLAGDGWFLGLSPAGFLWCWRPGGPGFGGLAGALDVYGLDIDEFLVGLFKVGSWNGKGLLALQT